MLSEYAIIEKSRNVVTMQCSTLNVGELKIFETYLSRIDPRDTDTREVIFTKYEYQKLLGVEKLDVSRFRDYVKHLRENDIIIPTKNGGQAEWSLFPGAVFEKINDEWTVTLGINPKLDEFFFNIQNLGYIKYRLAYTTKLQNKRDIKLYLFLKLYDFKDKPCNTFDVPLEKLKRQIECDKASYEEYREFNRVILKPSIQRINDYTDLIVTYKKKYKKSYEEEKITFTISRKEIEDEELVKLAEMEEETKGVSPYNLPQQVLEDAEQEDIYILVNLIKNVYENADIDKCNDIFKRVNIQCSFPKDVKSHYKYYRSILKLVLKKELDNQEQAKKQNEKNTHKTDFHNFEERRDINDLDGFLRGLN